MCVTSGLILYSNKLEKSFRMNVTLDDNFDFSNMRTQTRTISTPEIKEDTITDMLIVKQTSAQQEHLLQE